MRSPTRLRFCLVGVREGSAFALCSAALQGGMLLLLWGAPPFRFVKGGMAFVAQVVPPSAFFAGRPEAFSLSTSLDSRAAFGGICL